MAKSKLPDQPHYMWSYWRNKYGVVAALKEYYPNLLRTNNAAAQALNTVEFNIKVLDGMMTGLANSDPTNPDHVPEDD